jgi:AcrR family transcriptional regulator
MQITSPLESYAQSVLARKTSKSDIDERKERVIAATLVACSKTGPLAINISAIADEAGVSTASIYKIFINGNDVLTTAVLRAFDILLLDWSLDTAPDNQPSEPLQSITAFLIKFGETYRHAYSNWLLRADLAMSATESDDVRLALIGFQDRMVNYGLLTLPRDTLGFSYPRDLLHILMGGVQVHIVRALLSPAEEDNIEPNANHLDLSLVVEDVLNWITKAPAQNGFVANLGVGTLGDGVNLRQQSKSAVQAYVEDLLARPIARDDAKGRRNRLMAATMKHCAAKGMDGASVAQIAKLAGVSTASVYRQFEDKTSLIKASVGRFLPLYAQASMNGVLVPDPIERVKNLLAAQVITLTDPFGAWLYRYYVKLEAQQSDDMKKAAFGARQQSDQFWEDQLKRLESEGQLAPNNTGLTRTMLVGGIHRRCVLARVLHQNDELVRREVQASVEAATQMLFRLYGSTSLSQSVRGPTDTVEMKVA